MCGPNPPKYLFLSHNSAENVTGQILAGTCFLRGFDTILYGLLLALPNPPQSVFTRTCSLEVG